MIGTEKVEKDLKIIQQCLQEIMIQLKASELDKYVVLKYLEDAQEQLEYLIIHNRDRNIIETHVKEYLLSCVQGLETGVFSK